MAKFQITFEREVVQVDQFTRVIEAASEEEARQIAEGATGAYDYSCPDDAVPAGGDDCGSWTVHEVEPADDGEEVDELPDDHLEAGTL